MHYVATLSQNFLQIRKSIFRYDCGERASAGENCVNCAGGITLRCLFCGFFLILPACTRIAANIQDENALSQASDMYRIYLVKHNGLTPRNWGDLKDAYFATQDGYNNFSFEELQERISIDFEKVPGFADEPRVFMRSARRTENNALSPAEINANRRIENTVKALGSVQRYPTVTESTDEDAP